MGVHREMSKMARILSLDVILGLQLAIVGTACTEKEEIAQLKQQITNLHRDLDRSDQDKIMKDSQIDAAHTKVGLIYQALSNIEPEKVIRINESEYSERNFEEVKQTISDVRAKIADYQGQITNLKSENEKKGIRIRSLDKTIDTLQKMLDEKNHTIEYLREKVFAQGVTIDTLRTLNTELGEKIQHEQSAHDKDLARWAAVERDHVATFDLLQVECGSVWLVQGNEDDLVGKGILKVNGSFFGLGGTHEIVRPYPNAYTLVTNTVKELPINGAIIELLPYRSPNSYRTERTTTGDTLIISDPAQFWQDRYLVVLTQKGL